MGSREETELLRLADLVDATRGLVTVGLERSWLNSLFDSIPRDGLQRELLRHSLRGAPCISRGIVGAVRNVFHRSVPSHPSSRKPSDERPDAQSQDRDGPHERQH
jgi:hypothetical protein